MVKVVGKKTIELVVDCPITIESLRSVIQVRWVESIDKIGLFGFRVALRVKAQPKARFFRSLIKRHGWVDG